MIQVYHNKQYGIQSNHTRTHLGSPEETKRIQSLGGSVVNDEGVFRVEGVLGVSRAIGDHYLKPYVKKYVIACTFSELMQI